MAVGKHKAIGTCNLDNFFLITGDRDLKKRIWQWSPVEKKTKKNKSPLAKERISDNWDLFWYRFDFGNLSSNNS